MKSNASDSAKVFFACMSLAAVIISIRVKIVYKLDAESVRAVWNTYLFLFGVLPVFGIMSVFLYEFKIYVESKRNIMFGFFEYLGEKLASIGAGVLVGGGIGATVTAMLLFEPTWKGVILSWAVMAGGFILAMIGIAGKKFAEKFGEDAYTWSKNKTLKYRNGKAKKDKKRA